MSFLALHSAHQGTSSTTLGSEKLMLEQNLGQYSFLSGRHFELIRSATPRPTHVNFPLYIPREVAAQRMKAKM
jgi:hypothetical protein